VIRSARWLIHGALVAALALACHLPSAPGVETVRLDADGRGFVLQPSGVCFTPWGHNYASVDLLRRVADDPQRVEREFAEMKAAGTSVARIHPEMPRILPAPDRVDPEALGHLRTVLGIAERAGVHLMITGLACYTIADRHAWYDAMDEEARWATQALFWDAVARTCAGSPAVFAYDLVNEPAATGKAADGWYTGRMGDVEFCQRLSLDPARVSGDEVFREWTSRMVAAIRAHDRAHLITMGMLPFPGAYEAMAEQLDFVSPHLYPKTGKVDDEIALLRRFDWRKPIVVGETFPLTCSAAEEREFLLRSRGTAHGWLGHWPDESPSRLAERETAGTATIHDAIWLSWVRLFVDVGAEMACGRER